MSWVSWNFRASASARIPSSSRIQSRIPGNVCAQHLLLPLTFGVAVAVVFERVMAKLWNDPLWIDISFQQIQRLFNFRRVDVSLFTFQHGGFEDGENFEGGHNTAGLIHCLAQVNPEPVHAVSSPPPNAIPIRAFTAAVVYRILPTLYPNQHMCSCQS